MRAEIIDLLNHDVLIRDKREHYQSYEPYGAAPRRVDQMQALKFIEMTDTSL
jgi:hypothetical protein